VRVARALAARYPEAAGRDIWALHDAQAGWYAAWAEDFAGWLRRKGSADAVVDPHWPLRAAADG
jgi:DNA polymerase-3 subunit epsilon